MGHHGVVGPGQTRDRVEQDHHVHAVLHQAPGLGQHHVGHLDVPLSGLVEGGADDFAVHRPGHVRDFLRTLVDEQDDQVHFRMIGGDGVGGSSAG